jgi:hypothetical protein
MLETMRGDNVVAREGAVARLRPLLEERLNPLSEYGTWRRESGGKVLLDKVCGGQIPVLQEDRTDDGL